MRVGDKVRLICNKNMNAPIGSIATITKEPYDFNTWTVNGNKLTKMIDIKWDRPYMQCDGGYEVTKFELLSRTVDDQKVTQRTTKIDYMAITREICGAK